MDINDIDFYVLLLYDNRKSDVEIQPIIKGPPMVKTIAIGQQISRNTSCLCSIVWQFKSIALHFTSNYRKKRQKIG
jgi:hypothetical protein